METREDLKESRKKFRFLQLRWREPLGKKDCPYAYRWVLNLILIALRLHKWLRSDDKRYFHTHPYWFFTFVLKGSYTDVSLPDAERRRKPAGKNAYFTSLNGEIVLKEVLTAGSFRFRRANHAHYVEVPEGGCISLLITGPSVKKWGFLVNGKLKRPFKYFHKYGHPPCEEQ